MSTGRTIASTCAARAALAGNPSDGFGGAVVAVPIHDLCAVASATEASAFNINAADPDLERLLRATADRFEATVHELPPVTLSASTAIPRSVGLAGSSALVIAALRSLAGWTGARWSPIELARLALSVERDVLGIEAGLQDRLVQAVGDLVAMRFDPVDFSVMTPAAELPLFVAWSPEAAETSDTVHRSLRRRFDGADPKIRAAMAALADQAVRAQTAIETGDLDTLGDSMTRTLDIRMAIIDVGPAQRRLVRTGRQLGAAVNSAGSGGSVVGLARNRAELVALRQAYERDNSGFLELVERDA
jgi:glucuronokinase